MTERTRGACTHTCKAQRVRRRNERCLSSVRMHTSTGRYRDARSRSHTLSHTHAQARGERKQSKTGDALLREGMPGARSVGAKPSAVEASTAATAILDAVSATSTESFSPSAIIHAKRIPQADSQLPRRPPVFLQPWTTYFEPSCALCYTRLAEAASGHIFFEPCYSHEDVPELMIRTPAHGASKHLPPSRIGGWVGAVARSGMGLTCRQHVSQVSGSRIVPRRKETEKSASVHKLRLNMRTTSERDPQTRSHRTDIFGKKSKTNQNIRPLKNPSRFFFNIHEPRDRFLLFVWK